MDFRLLANTRSLDQMCDLLEFFGIVSADDVISNIF